MMSDVADEQTIRTAIESGTTYGRVAEVREAGRIGKGRVSPGVDLIEVTFEDGSALRVVRKRTSPAEVAALTALRGTGLVEEGRVPELIAHGDDWSLLRHYDGEHPADDSAIPDEVFDTLARVHATAVAPAGIKRVDPSWWSRLCHEMTLPDLRERAGEVPELGLAADELARTAYDERVMRAMEHLPWTLVHGDMHARNVVSGPAGTTIIDWESCVLGPPMMDVARLTEYGSGPYHRYLAEWRRLTGRDTRAELGHRWARVLLTTQRLGFTVSTAPPEQIIALVDERRRALDRVGELLGQ